MNELLYGNNDIAEYAKEIEREINMDHYDDFFNEKEIYNDIQEAKYNNKKFVVHLKEEEEMTKNNSIIIHQHILFIDLSKKTISEEKETVANYILEMVDSIKETLEEKGEKNKKTKLSVVYITNNYANYLLISQFKLENKKKNDTDSWKETLSEELTHKNYSKNQIKYVSRFIQTTKSKEEILIQINSRVKRATVEQLKNFNIDGDVFTASLYDLTTLFSEFGNDLFKYNLRVHISNGANDVDNKIKDTLMKYPEEFWFLNNGITVLVDSKNTHLRKSNILGFENLSKVNKEDIFSQLSIINGAQTISVATQYFLDLNVNEEDEKNRNRAKEQSKVILRVVKGDRENKNEFQAKEWINKIAISLNRQKPIKAQDIFYSHYFVSAMNEMSKVAKSKSENEENTFQIAKRGQEPSLKNKIYALDDVVRILYCYLGKQPGYARNSINDLIERDDFIDEKNIEEGKESSSNGINQIYYGEDILTDHTKEYKGRHEQFYEEVFLKYYNNINELMKDHDSISKCSKKINQIKGKVDIGNLINEIYEIYHLDQDWFDFNLITSILKYGKYHLLSMRYEMNKQLTGYELSFGSSNGGDFTILKSVIAFSEAWNNYVKMQPQYLKDKDVLYSIDLFKTKINKTSYKKLVEATIDSYEKYFGI